MSVIINIHSVPYGIVQFYFVNLKSWLTIRIWGN